ncbi:Crp/Fnr family transcriptional regulator [Mucilaginibacter sp.]
MATEHKLHEILFSMDNLPAELKDGSERNRLSRHLDSIIGFSHHTRTQLLLSTGQEAAYIYFLEKGVARGYYYDPQKEKEHTVILWDKGSIFTDPSGFFKKLPAGLNIEIMANSQLVFISRLQLMELYRLFPYTEIFTACMTSRFTAYFAKRSHDLVSLSAWERYQQLIRGFPGIEQKISKEMMASYIDVAPQSLSRLLKENRRF